MSRTVLTAALCAFFPLVGSPLYAQMQPSYRGAPAATVNPADKRFVDQAAEANMMAIAVGNSGAQHGTNAAIKDFGRSMAQEHTKANQQLSQMAGSMGITLPTTLTAQNQQIVNNLNNTLAANYDNLFLKQVIRDHNSALNIYRTEAQSGTNPQLKQYASNMVPGLEMHVTEAQNLLQGTSTTSAAPTSSQAGTAERSTAEGSSTAAGVSGTTVHYGTVTSLQPGQQMEVKLRGAGGTQVFNLKNMAADIAPGVTKGSQVKITDYTDPNGAHHLTVQLMPGNASEPNPNPNPNR